MGFLLLNQTLKKSLAPSLVTIAGFSLLMSLLLIKKFDKNVTIQAVETSAINPIIFSEIFNSTSAINPTIISNISNPTSAISPTITSSTSDPTSAISPTITSNISNSTSAISPTIISNSFVPPHDSFSACIMFKDDANRIFEWIAYHYHALSLRQIIVGVDGGTYPTELVTQYSDHIKITLWPQHVFAPDKEMNVSGRKAAMDESNKYIRRQTLFLRKCAVELRQQQRRWTAFIDPDEYLNFNRYFANQSSTIPNFSVTEEGSIYKFIVKEFNNSGSNSNPCITVPRLRFGNKLYAKVSSTLDTIRFRTHSKPKRSKKNGLGKTLLDLSRFTEKQLRAIKNVHGMVANVCMNPYFSLQESPLKINHYVGSKETFFHRQDARNAYGRLDTYDKAARVRGGYDDSIVPWFEGFLEKNGKAVVSKFFQGQDVLPKKKRRQRRN